MRVFARCLTVALAAALGASCATTAVVRQNVSEVIAGKSITTRDYPQAVRQDREKIQQQLTQLQAAFVKEVATLRAQAQKRWGAGAQVADKTVYVKYSQGYNTRVITDFDHGILTVESRDPRDPRDSLRTAIVSALLTSSDPAAVDLFSDRDVVVEASRRPYLYGLIHDNTGRSVGTRGEAQTYAAWLLANRARSRPVPANEGGGVAWFVNLTMVRNFEARGAERYRATVDRYAAQYHVSPSLVFAIIRTESNFNPFAVSGAPAYGLMQLVPTSGGRAAEKRVTGTEQTPGQDVLLDPEQNIQLGVAYLSVLDGVEFQAIANQSSRDYCVIAAYNTGAGNVTRVFDSDRHAALTAINGLQPPVLFQKLQSDLPYQETRTYVGRVTGYRKQFMDVAAAGPSAPAAVPAKLPAT